MLAATTLQTTGNPAWKRFPGRNSVPNSTKGSSAGRWVLKKAESVKECEGLSPRYNASIFAFNSNSNHCYLRFDDVWETEQNEHTTAGCLIGHVHDCLPRPPGPTPPFPPRGCFDDLHCSLNGKCNQATGVCICEPAWKGLNCSTLVIEPGTRNSGLRMIQVPAAGPPGTIPGNTSTWGGAALYDPRYKRWFMWATELKGHW